MNLKPFQKLVNLIKQSKTGYITKQELLEYDILVLLVLVVMMPTTIITQSSLLSN